MLTGALLICKSSENIFQIADIQTCIRRRYSIEILKKNNQLAKNIKIRLEF